MAPFLLLACSRQQAPVASPEVDQANGEIVLELLTSPSVTEEQLSSVLETLSSQTFTDSHLAVAVVAGEAANRIHSQTALTFFEMGAAHLREYDADASRLPGHIAVISFHLDRLRLNEGERGTEANRTQVAHWVRAARTLDLRNPVADLSPVEPRPLQGTGTELVALREEDEFSQEVGLRAWHAEWALGEVDIHLEAGGSALENLRSALSKLPSDESSRGLLEARIAVATTQAEGAEAGHTETLRVARGALSDTEFESPADAMNALMVIPSLHQASTTAVDAFFDEALAARGPSLQSGIALRLWAAAVDRPEGVATWANTDESSYWSVPDDWFALVPATAHVVASVYMEQSPDTSLMQVRRSVAYVAIYHHARDLLEELGSLDRSDVMTAQLHLETIVQHLIFLVTTLETEARLHEAAFPGSIQGIVTRAFEAAGVYDQQAQFGIAPLAEWVER